MGASKAWSSVAAAWFVLAVGLAAVVSSSEAYVFYAGGRDGWVLGPTESYNHWAGRNRFQVNDTIVFTHEEGVTSVLLVTEQDFDTCNTRSPVRRLEAVSGGRSVFRFDRSGPFFFISSDEDRCQKAQKLYIIVMAPRPPVAAAPAPGAGGSPQWTASPPAGGAAAPAPGGGSPQWTASPPAGGAAPPPLWASAPEYARGPGMSTMGASGRDGTSLSSSLGAPPPTAGASRSVGDAIVGTVVGVVGALVLCFML